MYYYKKSSFSLQLFQILDVTRLRSIITTFHVTKVRYWKIKLLKLSGSPLNSSAVRMEWTFARRYTSHRVFFQLQVESCLPKRKRFTVLNNYTQTTHWCVAHNLLFLTSYYMCCHGEKCPHLFNCPKTAKKISPNYIFQKLIFEKYFSKKEFYQTFIQTTAHLVLISQ